MDRMEDSVAWESRLDAPLVTPGLVRTYGRLFDRFTLATVGASCVFLALSNPDTSSIESRKAISRSSDSIIQT